MVLHANIDAVSPSTTLLQSNLAPKKYVVVKNHVREISKSNENTQLGKSDNSKRAAEEKVDQTRKRKSKTPVVNQSLQYTGYNDRNSVPCEINQSDLEELRQVYIQCKSVIHKIETKYSHLLNLENIDECKCTPNKKIVFDEDGQQHFNHSRFENHICFNKWNQVNKTNLQIEYTTDSSLDLPDNLKELGNLLKEPINYRLRRFVINKMKGLRQDYMNKLKDDKHSIVKKLKENPPEDLLGFEGTNLSTISGYPA